MVAEILYFASVVATTMPMVATKSQPSNFVVNINNLAFKDEFAEPVLREKRMAINYAKLGQKAVSKLLNGAKTAKSGGRRVRNYEKDGDMGTAMNDFYSVRPVKVYEAATKYGGNVLRGTAGDRDLMLYTTDHQGFPVLEVIDYLRRNSGGPYIDRIVYKTGVIKDNYP